MTEPTTATITIHGDLHEVTFIDGTHVGLRNLTIPEITTATPYHVGQFNGSEHYDRLLEIISEICPKADIELGEPDSSIVTFHLNSERVREWVADNVEIPDHMWIGEHSFACELNFAEDIAMAMLDEQFDFYQR